MNSTDTMDDEIRVPDEYFFDQLIPTNNNDYVSNNPEQEVERAIQLSANTYEDEQIFAAILAEVEFISKQETEKKQRELRCAKFAEFKPVLYRLAKLDEKNKNVIDLILSVILLYEDNDIITYEVEPDIYTNLLNFTKTIRVSKKYVDDLYLIIVSK